MTQDPGPETWDLGRRPGTWNLGPLFFFMPLLPPIFFMHLYPPIFSTLEKNDLHRETFALHVIALQMPILIYSCEEVVRKRRFDYAILVTSSVALVMVKLICSMLEERCAVMKRVNYARMTKKSLFVCWCYPHWSIALAKKHVMCIPSGQSGCKGSKCKHGKMKSGDKN